KQTLAGADAGRRRIGDQRGECVVCAHPRRRAAAEVAVAGIEGEGREMEHRAQTIARVGAGMPAGARHEHKPQGLRAHTRTTAVSAIAASSAATTSARPAPSKRKIKRCRRATSATPVAPRAGSNDTARVSPNAPPTAAPAATEPHRNAPAAATYTAALVTIVASPTPSWAPNAPP